MIANAIQQHSTPVLILLPIEAKSTEQGATSAEEAYFASLLDIGDEAVDPGSDTPSPIDHVTAGAPTMAAYLIGLLDDSEE